MATPSTNFQLLPLQRTYGNAELGHYSSKRVMNPHEEEIQERIKRAFQEKDQIERAAFSDRFKANLMGSGNPETVAMFFRFAPQFSGEALISAAKNGFKCLIETYIENGEDLDAQDSTGKTALLWALENKHGDIVALLLKAGAKDEKGRTRLIRAILTKDYAMIKEFRSNLAMLNDPDFSGRTPLMHAIELGDLVATALVLEKKPQLEASDPEGLTAIHYAVKQQNEKSVSHLLENGADVDALTKLNRTPLMLAATLPDKGIFKRLLQAHPKIALIGKKGESALSEALQNGQIDHVNTLLNALEATSLNLSPGLSLTSSSSLSLSLEPTFYLKCSSEELSKDPSLLLAIQSGKNEMALHLAKNKIGIFYQNEGQIPLIVAVKEELFSLVQVLLEGGVDLEEVSNEGYSACSYAYLSKNSKIENYLLDGGARNFSGETLITDAIEKGDLHALQVSLKMFSGTKIIEKRNRNGETPLTLAVAKQNSEMVRLLISAGASVSAKNRTHTPFALAMTMKPLAPSALILQLIHAGADVHAHLADSLTALHVAIEQNDFSLIEGLLSKKVNLEEKNERGETALILASRIISDDKIEGIRALCSLGSNINAQCQAGNSALIWAVKNGNEGLVKFLIEAKALINLKNREGLSALQIAFNMKYKEIEKYLWESGACNGLGMNILGSAVRERNIPKIKELIARKFDLNIQDLLGQTVLSLAVSLNFEDVCCLLLEAGTNPNFPTKLGSTPLLKASFDGNDKMIKLLLAKGANLKHRMRVGSTALHLAAKQKNIETLKLLISLGIDLDALDNERMTALQQIYESSENPLSPESLQVVQILLEAGARDRAGFTPLMRAIKENNHTIFRQLIDQKVDLDAYVDRKPIETALYMCIKMKNVEAFIDLVKAGARLDFQGNGAESYLEVFIPHLYEENEKYQRLLNFFFPTFEKGMMAQFPTTKDFCNAYVDSFKRFDAVLATLPVDSRPHFLGLGFFFNHIRKLIISKLSLDEFNCGCQLLQKEFSTSKFLYNRLKEENLQIVKKHFSEGVENSILELPSRMDLEGFVSLFKQINFSEPQLPKYVPLDALKGDGGSSLTLEDLDKGLATYVRRIKAQEPFLGTPKSNTSELTHYYECLTDIAHHLLLKLHAPDTDPDNKTALLIDLANAGNYCGARYMSESYSWYQRIVLKAEPESQTVPKKVLSILIDFRLKILSDLVLTQKNESGVLVPLPNLPHIQNQYFDLIGKECGLRGYVSAHADPGFFRKELTHKVAQSNFFNHYKPTALIDHFQEIFSNYNATGITRQEVIYWFEGQMPENWKEFKYRDLTQAIAQEIEKREDFFAGLSVEEEREWVNEYIKTKIFPCYKLPAIEDPRSLKNIDELIDVHHATSGKNVRDNMKKKITEEILAFDNPGHLNHLAIKEVFDKYHLMLESSKTWNADIRKNRVQEFMTEEVYSQDLLGFKRSAIVKLLVAAGVLDPFYPANLQFDRETIF